MKTFLTASGKPTLFLPLLCFTFFCSGLSGNSRDNRANGNNSSTVGNLAASNPGPARPQTTQATENVLVGAGDIADCADLSGAEATAKLLDAIPGTVFTAGDNAYEEGTAEQFAKCYNPTWGRHRARTRPSVGNHEFHSGGATPYFDYFGAAAGDPARGY